MFTPLWFYENSLTDPSKRQQHEIYKKKKLAIPHEQNYVA